MASKKYSHRDSPSSASLVRLDPPSTVESLRQSSSMDDGPIMREIDEYMADLREDCR